MVQSHIVSRNHTITRTGHTATQVSYRELSEEEQPQSRDGRRDHRARKRLLVAAKDGRSTWLVVILREVRSMRKHGL